MREAEVATDDADRGGQCGFLPGQRYVLSFLSTSPQKWEADGNPRSAELTEHRNALVGLVGGMISQGQARRDGTKPVLLEPEGHTQLRQCR